MRTQNNRHRPIAFGGMAAAVLATALLTGCGASSPDLGGSDGAAIPAADIAYGGDAAAYEEADIDMASASLNDAAESGAVVDEQVIRTGNASVTVDDPYAAMEALAEKVTALGGNVAYSSQWTSGDRPRAEATLRVPADQFDALLAWLPDLGEVQDQSTQSEDVTTQVTDLTARIAALKASIERLTTLMGEAETTADLLEAESMLTQRQAEVDSLTSTLEYLTNQVDLSTLTVSLSTAADAPGPSLSWSESWQSFVNALLWLLNVLIFALPWLVILTVITVAWRLVRRSRKHRTIRSEHVIEPTED